MFIYILLLFIHFANKLCIVYVSLHLQQNFLSQFICLVLYPLNFIKISFLYPAFFFFLFYLVCIFHFFILVLTLLLLYFAIPSIICRLLNCCFSFQLISFLKRNIAFKDLKLNLDIKNFIIIYINVVYMHNLMSRQKCQNKLLTKILIKEIISVVNPMVYLSNKYK